MFISAAIGAGHHATASALETTAQRLWPGCETRWIDALEAMGPGVGPLFRRIYVINVQTTPWLYEFFYHCLWRHRWFSAAVKRCVAAWVGRRLIRMVDDYDPDLVVSTYPFASAGMQWLRRRRRLAVPAVTWVPDFAPHPLWVYRDLDMHFVMHPICMQTARDAEPGAKVAVAAPPVRAAFGAGCRAEARHALGLPEDAFMALISSGYYGFGTIETAVDALLETHPDLWVVVLCGNNARLRARLDGRAATQPRLLPQGWVDNMPTYMRASDIVVTNGNAATALEALSCGRVTVIFEPIAAHGRANAELMARAGLALVCPTASELETTVRNLMKDPDWVADLEDTARTHTRARAIADDLRLATSLTPVSPQAARSAGKTPEGDRGSIP